MYSLPRYTELVSEISSIPLIHSSAHVHLIRRMIVAVAQCKEYKLLNPNARGMLTPEIISSRMHSAPDRLSKKHVLPKSADGHSFPDSCYAAVDVRPSRGAGPTRPSYPGAVGDGQYIISHPGRQVPSSMCSDESDSSSNRPLRHVVWTGIPKCHTQAPQPHCPPSHKQP